jgi:2-polyprenyl-3-methyl-5-hydroxy-6-metoxy-1,4-benzoquinol methylase
MAEQQPALNLLLVPNLRADRGLGHLKRCLKAASSAGAGAAVLYSRDQALTAGRPVFARSVVAALAAEACVRLVDEWPADPVSTVVADLQAADHAAFDYLRQRSVRLVGWDEGGSARSRFPFLVDSLPHDTSPEPNVRLPGLLGLPLPARGFERPIKRVLAAFGGADPAGLTPRFLRFVQTLRAKGEWPYHLTVVRGPVAGFVVPSGVDEVLEAPSDLASMLGQWDLTVTSWGLTALESLAAGTPVVLFNPTAYHEQLTVAAGLPSLGVKRLRSMLFRAHVEDAPRAAAAAASRLLGEPRNAGRYFAGFTGSDGRCPVCRTSGHPVFARTEHKSYHRCRCGMEYLSVHQLPPKEYSEAYFFEDYQKQYGKTYLDDFAHIQDLGRQRLAILDATFGARPGRRVFDVGCAYGPFLAAAAEAGHVPFGLDVAEGAVAHVRGLGFRAVKASFTDFVWEREFPEEPRPDALTMWFVIEHFADLDTVLRKVSASLPPGGLFAFSTPNGRGITRRFSPDKFWRESPDDHFSIWSPANARAALKRFGFEVKAFRVTGHHPERFPGVKAGWGLKTVSLLSRLAGWGDTFEVYAAKTGDPE